MADGFSVDVTALQQAAFGVSDTLNQLDERKVSKLDPSKAAMGHQPLASTLSDFCDRWQLGVEHLAKDAQEIADRLIYCAVAYAKNDNHGADLANGVLTRLTGPDPGAP